MHNTNFETSESTVSDKIGECPTADMIAGAVGIRAVRIASVMAQIQDGFTDQQFSTRVVAERLGLSVRYVQDLLQASGLSITDRIMQLRLDKARAMLLDDRSCTLKISDVAASCGFNELSYFHRSFRRRFGASPAKFRMNSLN
eukprot:gene52992-72354_t